MSVPEFISDRVELGRYYFLDLDASAGGALRVVCGGREVCGRRYEVCRDSFRYWAVEFVEAGEGELTVDGHAFALRPGSVYSYGPGVAHTLRSAGDRPLVKHFVDFTGRSARGLLGASGVEGGPGRVAPSRWVQGLFEHLLEAGRSQPAAFAGAQCVALLRPLLNQIAHDLVPAEAVGSPAFETYVRCRGYLLDHFANLATVAEAAEACGIDPAYLSRLFARFADEGAHTFLTRVKVTHAAELLAGQGLSVQAAGRAAGYDDPYHFSRVFKRVQGVSPRAFAERAARR
ncbi:MAG: helix-turn-helix domain-containing protein [Planctomycetota bacterium]